MTLIEIIVIILTVLFLSSVIIGQILKKKKGKSSCGDCSTCNLNCNKTSLLERYRSDYPNKEKET